MSGIDLSKDIWLLATIFIPWKKLTIKWFKIVLICLNQLYQKCTDSFSLHNNFSYGDCYERQHCSVATTPFSNVYRTADKALLSLSQIRYSRCNSAVRYTNVRERTLYSMGKLYILLAIIKCHNGSYVCA